MSDWPKYPNYDKYVAEVEEQNKKINFQNFLLFVLGSVSFIISWIGYHFLNWSIVETGMLFMLGILFLGSGGYYHVKGLQSFSNDVRNKS